MIKIDFSVRLVLCANGVAVGPRLSRSRPLPSYQQSYDDTPEGRKLAERDLARMVQYLSDYEEKR